MSIIPTGIIIISAVSVLHMYMYMYMYTHILTVVETADQLLINTLIRN